MIAIYIIVYLIVTAALWFCYRWAAQEMPPGQVATFVVMVSVASDIWRLFT